MEGDPLQYQRIADEKAALAKVEAAKPKVKKIKVPAEPKAKPAKGAKLAKNTKGRKK